MSNENFENFVPPAAERLLVTLKKRGPQTAAELGCAAGVCGEAARQQLVRLAADGLVAATSRPRGVGRPAQVWELTPDGHARFRDGHAELAGTLIRLIRSQLGQDVLDRLIEARAAEQAAAYRKLLEGTTGLGDRVRMLAEIRAHEGYMAECVRTDEGYLLVESHCPIAIAVQSCPTFCRSELAMFQAVLGEDVTVDHVEHVIHGDRRCAYRIIPRQQTCRPTAPGQRAIAPRPRRQRK